MILFSQTPFYQRFEPFFLFFNRRLLSKFRLKYIGKHNHIFGRVPLIPCPANTERKSGFHDVISLFDAYNTLNSDLVNEIADHRNAYLVIENAKLEADDLLNMKKMGIIQVPAGGKVSWLTKEINDSFVKNELDNIERKIFDMMDQVNFNENWAAIPPP
ncbi:phage portal protein [Paenibacillus sp. NPDC055715]